MGTYVWHYGTSDVDPEKLPELVRYLKEFTEKCGMMGFEEVSMFGRRILLLVLPSVDKNGVTGYHYNYMSDEMWEDAGYNVNTGKIWSNKIGQYIFHAVVVGTYVLAEFYNRTPLLTGVDGTVINARNYISWLNYVLGTEFTNKRVQHPVHLLQSCPSAMADKYPNIYCIESEGQNHEELMWWYFITSPGLDDLMREPVTPSERIEDNRPVTFAKLMYEAVKTLGTYPNITADDKLKEIGTMLSQPLADREAKYKDTPYADVAKYSAYCPPLYTAKCAADLFDEDMLMLWRRWRPKVIEWLSFYKSEDLDYPPLPPMSTVEILGLDNSDDLAYYWSPEGDIHFSDDMKEWIKSVYTEYTEILGSDESDPGPVQSFMEQLMAALSEASDIYGRIFCFKDAFYDLVNKASEKCAWATLILFRRLAERGKEDGLAADKSNFAFDYGKRSTVANPGRLAVKRYMALLGNKGLRMRIFGF